MSQIAGLQDFRQQAPPADIGLYQFLGEALVFKFTFAGTDYVGAVRAGESGWVLIDYAVSSAANDSAAIQAAVDEFINGGKVHLLAFTFNIANPILIRDAVDFELWGSGWGTKLVAVGDITPIQIGDRAGDHPSVRIYIGHLYIDGTDQTAYSEHSAVFPRSEGIDISGVGCYDIIVEKCYVYNTGFDGIYGWEATGYVLIVDNIVTDQRDGYGGIHPHGARANWHIINNNVYSCNAGGIRHGEAVIGNYIYSCGVLNYPAITSGNEGSRVIGNRIYNTRANGIGIQVYGWGVIVADNYIHVAYSNGIEVFANLHHVMILENYLYDCRLDGINVASNNDVQVIGNHLDRINRHGIHFNAASRGVISENVIHDAGQQTDATYHGIYLEATSADNIININQIYSDAANTTLHGIFLTASDDNTVNGNRISNLAGDGIRLDNASWNIIGGSNKLRGNAGFGINLNANADFNSIENNYTRTNTSGCANIGNANCNNNVFTNNQFDEGDIADVGANTRAWLNYDPSAGAFITAINPPQIIDGVGAPVADRFLP